MRYESHGKFTIYNQGNIIVAELIGSWNEESALQFESEFKKVASIMPKQWGHIVYLNNWELCVPGMMPIIERLVAWCIENGLIRAANIYPCSAIKTQVINKMVVTKHENFERAIFDNEQDAAIWLSREGFPVAIKNGVICSHI